jgi:alkylation response protein AidB-like acyl-CoA dehydrogenase
MDSLDKPPAFNLEGLPRTASPEVLAEIACRFAESAAQHDREGSFAHENIALLREHGITGLAAVRALAGDPLSLQEAREVITAVARGEPSTALILIMTYVFVIQAADNPNWNPALRRHVLEDIARNNSQANALRVEPELGTPVRGGIPATVARRVPGGFRVSGHKLYSTGIPALKWLGVWGRTDDASPLVGTFLVPREADGIRVVESWDSLGLRASGSHDVIFEDVFIPAEYAVDIRPPEAWANARGGVLASWMSTLMGAMYDAVARNARDWLVRFALERKPANLGVALATLPRFQEAVGEIDALLHINQALLDRATQAPAGTFTAQDGNFLKYTVTGNAIKVVERALAITGNPGLARGNPLERHYRDALCGRVHAPQDDTILTAAGQAAFAAARAAQHP